MRVVHSQEQQKAREMRAFFVACHPGKCALVHADQRRLLPLQLSKWMGTSLGA